MIKYEWRTEVVWARGERGEAINEAKGGRAGETVGGGGGAGEERDRKRTSRRGKEGTDRDIEALN